MLSIYNGFKNWPYIIAEDSYFGFDDDDNKMEYNFFPCHQKRNSVI